LISSDHSDIGDYYAEGEPAFFLLFSTLGIYLLYAVEQKAANKIYPLYTALWKYPLDFRIIFLDVLRHDYRLGLDASKLFLGGFRDVEFVDLSYFLPADRTGVLYLWPLDDAVEAVGVSALYSSNLMWANKHADHALNLRSSLSCNHCEASDYLAFRQARPKCCRSDTSGWKQTRLCR